MGAIRVRLPAEARSKEEAMEKWKIKALGAAGQLKRAGRVREYQTIMSQLRKIEEAEKNPQPTPPKVKGRWMYRLYSASDELLYIGITDRGHTREKEHARLKPWWPEVHHATYEPVDTRAELKHRESVAIRRERPKYNIQYNN
jgi:predicted GIY-YIG superfamily endonuclease